MQSSEHVTKPSHDNQLTKTNSDNDDDDAFGDYGEASVNPKVHKYLLEVINAFRLSF